MVWPFERPIDRPRLTGSRADRRPRTEERRRLHGPDHTDDPLGDEPFTVLGRRLSARYVELHDRASDEYERRCWEERVIDLRERRRSVASDDVETRNRYVREWTALLADLLLLDEE
jgi:hypothetical protein